MDHSSSLARRPHHPGPSQYHRDSNGRRRSISQSLASWGSSSGRRVTVWMDSLSNAKGEAGGGGGGGGGHGHGHGHRHRQPQARAHSQGRPPLPHHTSSLPLPARPHTGSSHQTPRPRFHVSSHLSCSTPSLFASAFNPPLPLPPTPPPSPPESFSSLKAALHRPAAMDYPVRLDGSRPNTPPDSQSSSTTDLRRVHSRTRSLTAPWGESLPLVGRRNKRRNAAVNSPLPPPPKLDIGPPVPPKSSIRRKPVPQSPPPPAIPQKHPRAAAFPAPIVVQTFESAAPVNPLEPPFAQPPLLEVARTPQHPLRVINRSLPSPSAERRGAFRAQASPIRMGMARTPRSDGGSIMMQPSENESREFTKANTLQVQRRLAEVEAARMKVSSGNAVLDNPRDIVAVSGTAGARESCNSLDAVFANYGSSDDSATDVPRPWKGRPSRLSSSRGRMQRKNPGESHTDLGLPQVSAIPQALVLNAPPRVLRRPGLLSRPSTPPSMEWQGYEKWDPDLSLHTTTPPPSTKMDIETSFSQLTTTPSSATMNIETAFSTHGGFGTGGLWRRIGSMLEPCDIARLSRVSKRLRRSVEPLLYESIVLRPKLPHGYSCSYLSHLFSSLHMKENRVKLQKWTKSFSLENGWEENQITLMDNGSFLMDEEIIDPETGKTIISKEQMKQLKSEEGLVGDGGIKEVNAYMSDILERMPNITSFTWGSPLPLRGHLITALASLKHVTHLTLNLSQPMRKERCKDGSSKIQWAQVTKYRPNIGVFASLPLVELHLINLPTRGGIWWRQVWYIVAGSVDTLRVLKLEMPHITHERYPGLFDRYYRIYHVPAHDEDERHLKTPPVFDWKAFTAAKKALKHTKKKLQLCTIELTGFVVDEKIINWEIAPGKLKNLVLLGCIEKAGFHITKDCWRGMEVFRSTGFGFVERVVEALYTSGFGPMKQVSFLTDANEKTERDGDREALAILRRIVIDAIPKCGGRVDKLVLKEQWALNRKELEKVFSGADELVEIALSVENTTDAWDAFLTGLVKCPRLRKVHLLNGLTIKPGTRYGMGTPNRRFIADDAKFIETALIKAAENGSGVQLHGLMIAVSLAAWKIMKMDGGWHWHRIPGLLETTIVGCDAMV